MYIICLCVQEVCVCVFMCEQFSFMYVCAVCKKCIAVAKLSISQ